MANVTDDVDLKEINLKSAKTASNGRDQPFGTHLNGHGCEEELESQKRKETWEGAVIKDKSLWFSAKYKSHDAVRLIFS